MLQITITEIIDMSNSSSEGHFGTFQHNSLHGYINGRSYLNTSKKNKSNFLSNEKYCTTYMYINNIWSSEFMFELEEIFI